MQGVEDNLAVPVPTTKAQAKKAATEKAKATRAANKEARRLADLATEAAALPETVVDPLVDAELALERKRKDYEESVAVVNTLKAARVEEHEIVADNEANEFARSLGSVQARQPVEVTGEEPVRVMVIEKHAQWLVAPSSLMANEPPTANGSELAGLMVHVPLSEMKKNTIIIGAGTDGGSNDLVYGNRDLKMVALLIHIGAGLFTAEARGGEGSEFYLTEVVRSFNPSLVFLVPRRAFIYLMMATNDDGRYNQLLDASFLYGEDYEVSEEPQIRRPMGVQIAAAAVHAPAQYSVSMVNPEAKQKNALDIAMVKFICQRNYDRAEFIIQGNLKLGKNECARVRVPLQQIEHTNCRVVISDDLLLALLAFDYEGGGKHTITFNGMFYNRPKFSDKQTEKLALFNAWTFRHELMDALGQTTNTEWVTWAGITVRLFRGTESQVSTGVATEYILLLFVRIFKELAVLVTSPRFLESTAMDQASAVANIYNLGFYKTWHTDYPTWAMTAERDQRPTWNQQTRPQQQQQQQQQIGGSRIAPAPLNRSAQQSKGKLTPHAPPHATPKSAAGCMDEWLHRADNSKASCRRGIKCGFLHDEPWKHARSKMETALDNFFTKGPNKVTDKTAVQDYIDKSFATAIAAGESKAITNDKL